MNGSGGDWYRVPTGTNESLALIRNSNKNSKTFKRHLNLKLNLCQLVST